MSENRKVFPYHDGSQQVFGDPFAINKRLWAAVDGRLEKIAHDAFLPPLGPGEPERDPSEHVKAIAAQQALLAAVRQAFEMAPFDRTTGQGATDQDCLDAYDAFITWMAEKKTSSAPTPTS